MCKTVVLFDLLNYLGKQKINNLGTFWAQISM
jgi:hypothetical protein